MNREHYEKVLRVLLTCESVMAPMTKKFGARDGISKAMEPCRKIWEEEFLVSMGPLDLSGADCPGGLFMGHNGSRAAQRRKPPGRETRFGVAGCCVISNTLISHARV